MIAHLLPQVEADGVLMCVMCWCADVLMCWWCADVMMCVMVCWWWLPTSSPKWKLMVCCLTAASVWILQIQNSASAGLGVDEQFLHRLQSSPSSTLSSLSPFSTSSTPLSSYNRHIPQHRRNHHNCQLPHLPRHHRYKKLAHLFTVTVGWATWASSERI